MNDAEALFKEAVERHAAGDFEQAQDLYARLLAAHPEINAVRNNLAVCWLEQGRAEEALSLLEELATGTGAKEALTNWGNALRGVGRFAEAEAAFRKALEQDASDAKAHSNLALALQDQGRVDEAVAGFAKAVALAPGLAQLRANLGGALLMAGDYARGFSAYEFRLAGSATEAAMKSCGLPVWDGAPLAGRPLLVWTEQGLGDSLQFLRFLPKLDGPAHVMAQAGLMRLASAVANVASVRGWSDPPPLDCALQAPLLSLPRLLGCKSESDAPPFHLKADPLLVQLWGQRLGARKGPRIGLSWRGNPAMRADRFRSASLVDLSPLFAQPGMTWISLQTGEAAEAITVANASILNLGPEISDMADTAAIVSHLDLVIAVDSAVAHLAGCLNAPTWIMVRANPDWRWKPHETASAWYPSARLWRQQRLGDWSGVAAEMASALPTFFASRP